VRYGIAPLFFLVLLNTMGSAWAEKRIALVIGNGSYQHVPRLLNPRNDAEDVAASLRRSGFDVTLSFDLDKSGMDQATIDFSRAARTADIALFYYTGHAMQFAGVNYLAPVDLDLTDEADLRRMTRVDEIVADLQQAKTLRILVLDSCRDNPFVDQLKRSLGATRAISLQRGLAKIDSPEGMIISYATQSGRTATDGTGRNSPYTSAFLKHIEEQEEIGTIFRRIGSDVYTITSGGQLPELSLSFVGEFYLRGRLDIAVKPGIPASNPCAAATEHWKSAEAIGTVAAFEDHAARFPQCAFAGLAKSRIAALTLPSSPLPAADVRRFDGIWISTFACEAKTPDVVSFSTKFITKVKDAVLHGEKGIEGTPGWAIYDGEFEPDGTIEISVKDITGDPKLSGLPKGTRREWLAIGKFEGSHGNAVSISARNCTLSFAKPSSGATASMPAPMVTASDVDRFDGLWLVEVVCGESERGESPYVHKFFATISNGVLRGQVGPQAKPGGAVYDGTIESDGSMVVIAKGITGPTYRPKPNADFTYQLGGRLEGSQGSAIRLDRTCDVRFAKQPAGAGPMVAPAVAASPAAGGPVHRFDGLWTTTVVCEPTANALGWSNKFVAQVNDSTFQGHLGTEGKPGWATFDGTIKPNGDIEIIWTGLTGDPKTNPGNGPPGRPFTVRAYGRFEGSQGSAIRREMRSCHLDFVKERSFAKPSSGEADTKSLTKKR
jgi:uncharacterized caspase-like protein